MMHPRIISSVVQQFSSMDRKFNLFWNHSAPLIGRVSTVRPLQNIAVQMFRQCIAMMNDEDMDAQAVDAYSGIPRQNLTGRCRSHTT